MAVEVNQDAVDLAVSEQETRKATYLALKERGLPVPADLRYDFDPVPPRTSTGQVVIDLSAAADRLLDTD